MIGFCMPSQSVSEKHNQEKKPTYLFAPCEFLKKQIVRHIFDQHTIMLF